MAGFSFRWSIFMRSVASPSANRPRRMSSNSRSDSPAGRSRHGDGSPRSRDASISALVWWHTYAPPRLTRSTARACRVSKWSDACVTFQGVQPIQATISRMCSMYSLFSAVGLVSSKRR
jgi:hypothetical protein